VKRLPLRSAEDPTTFVWFDNDDAVGELLCYALSCFSLGNYGEICASMHDEGLINCKKMTMTMMLDNDNDASLSDALQIIH
jgi:hypothetical protein